MAQISATVRKDTVDFFTKRAKKKGVSFSHEIDNALTKYSKMKVDELDRLLISFGEYLLSEKRKAKIETENEGGDIPINEKLKIVSLADLRVWNEKVGILDI